MIPDVIKRTLASRVWLWPLVVATILVGLDLAGHKLSPEVLITVGILVLGSTGTEGVRDVVSRGTELAKIVHSLLDLFMKPPPAPPVETPASMDPLPGVPPRPTSSP